MGKQKTNKIFRAFAIACALCVGITSVPQRAFAATSTQSIAIPAYEYPTLTDLWPDIDAAGGSNIPFVIVNPASGPGASVDPNYTARISQNTSLDIRSIGYVDTSYQARPVGDVLDDIDQWYTLYPDITGIFIDQVSAVDAAALCYTAYIYNYIKVKHPSDIVSQNFGTYTPPSYEPYGDIFVNAEMDYALYQTWSLPTDGFQNVANNSNRFWHMIHTTTGANYADALADTQANNAGWVYITDDILPNPYDAAPSYFSTELSDVNLLPNTTIPNRGITELPANCLDVESTVNSTVNAGSTTATFSITNNSSTYQTPSPNRFSFALPAGVTLTSASGTGWSCTGTTCNYANTLGTNSSSPALSATFTTDCSYTSGTISITTTTFPARTTTDQLNVNPPGDCSSETLADTGTNLTVLVGTAGMLFMTGLTLFIRRRPTVG